MYYVAALLCKFDMSENWYWWLTYWLVYNWVSGKLTWSEIKGSCEPAHGGIGGLGVLKVNNTMKNPMKRQNVGPQSIHVPTYIYLIYNN